MKKLNEMNLTELSHNEMQSVEGGSYVYFRDSQGYLWQYQYGNDGALISVCVTKSTYIQ